MAQFDVYANRRPSSIEIPYLLDVQSDIVDLATRLVIPLVRRDAFGPAIDRLNPVVIIDAQELVASAGDLAGLPASQLGAFVTHIGHERERIMAAIDLLLTGV
ncbi:MAG TPA: CcdB family protein [Salinisphaeraceae bacterium]|nr:CcdB family protein [Salinisphaeraceae bacterium]